MMTQNSKQSQNNKTKIKSQSVTFTIAVMEKKEKNHIKNWKNIM